MAYSSRQPAHREHGRDESGAGGLDRGARILGPCDSGRVMSLDDFQSCIEADGWFAELIDGVVHMSPSPKPYHHFWRTWLARHIESYGLKHPGRVAFVETESDVIVPEANRLGPTRPRPDLTVYQGSWSDSMLGSETDWADLPPPLIVAEVLSSSTKEIDLHYKANLYWEQEGIAEYWIVDPLSNSKEPDFIVHQRTADGAFWEKSEFKFGEEYACTCLPGLKVNLQAIRQTHGKA